MRLHVVDPSAFTPPYDHALCGALAGEPDLDVELVTSKFAYGPVPRGDGYAVTEFFYRRALGAPGSRLRLATKLAQHVPDMLRYRRYANGADVVLFEWLTVQPLDVRLLPRTRPVLLTAHDVLPREPRPGQREAQRRLYERVDGVIVHSEHGRGRLTAELGIDPAKVHVVPHPPFDHLARQSGAQPLPPELAAVEGPVVLCFGLLRPYKGIDVLLEAWRGIEGAELWVVGLPKMPLEPLRDAAPPGVRFVPRFITDPEIPAYFRRADLVVLPYREIDESGVLATALAFEKPLVLTEVGGFPEAAAYADARLVPPDDPAALHDAITAFLRDGPGPAPPEGRSAQLWTQVRERTAALVRSVAGA